MKNILTVILTFLSLSLFAQQIEEGHAEFRIWITDFENIPESEAKITVFDDEGFKEEGVTDIDGKVNITVPQGKSYKVNVGKFDTTFYFHDGIMVPTEPVGYPFSLQLKIKLINQYIKISNLAIHFASNVSAIDKKYNNALDDLYKQLKANPNMRIELAAHTDNVGSDEANMRLSQRRADSVKDYLINKGIAKNRIVSKGYGESDPLADNATEEGKARNRRTEVRVISE